MSNTKEYTATWSIQIDAESPEEAAKIAEEICSSRPDLARSWEILECDNKDAEPQIIDLTEVLERE